MPGDIPASTFVDIGVFLESVDALFPETHESAPVALPSLDPDLLAQSGGDPTEASAKSGGDPADSAAREFHTAAARVIMKVMYAARRARPDLLRTIAYLARFPTNR